MKLNIVMVEPEIPQNTGNIARTCAITGAKLHLVHPLGFQIDDKYLKRSGLDYWDKLDIEEHDSLDEFLEKYKPEEHNMFFATTKVYGWLGKELPDFAKPKVENKQPSTATKSNKKAKKRQKQSSKSSKNVEQQKK